MYHIEVLNCSMATIHYVKYFNVDLDEEFLEKYILWLNI